MSATLSNIRLVDAFVLVGPQQTQLQGLGEDMFSLAPAGDESVMVRGAQGDIMMVDAINNGYILTLNFFTASPGITTVLTLHRTLRIWPITIAYGAFNMGGFANLLNRGEMAAGLGANLRTLTLNIASVTGNIDAAPGDIISANLPQ